MTGSRALFFHRFTAPTGWTLIQTQDNSHPVDITFLFSNRGFLMIMIISFFYFSQAFTLSISYLFIGLGFIIIDLFDKFPTAFSFSFLFFTVAVGRMYLRKSFSFSTFGFTRDLFLYFQKLASLLIEKRFLILIKIIFIFHTQPQRYNFKREKLCVRFINL